MSSDQSETTPIKGEVWSPPPTSRSRPRIILPGTRGETVWSAPLKVDGKPAKGGQCWTLRNWLKWVSDNAAEKVA